MSAAIITREHYMAWDSSPESIKEWLVFFEGAIIKQVLSEHTNRPVTLTVTFDWEMFDENPESTALQGLAGWRVIATVYMAESEEE